jgi:hypothetical protein
MAKMALLEADEQGRASIVEAIELAQDTQKCTCEAHKVQ